MPIMVNLFTHSLTSYVINIWLHEPLPHPNDSSVPQTILALSDTWILSVPASPDPTSKEWKKKERKQKKKQKKVKEREEEGVGKEGKGRKEKGTNEYYLKKRRWE